MSESCALVEGFDTKPSRSDAPDECQYQSCADVPHTVVRFREPKEYLCYCPDHADQVYAESDAKYRTALR